MKGERLMKKFLFLLAVISMITIWAPAAYGDDVKAPTAVEDVTVAKETPAEAKAPEGGEAAPATPVDLDEIVEEVTLLIQLFKNGQWALAVGLLLSLLIMVFRKFFEKYVPKKALPWVAVVLGIVGSVAVGLSAGVVWWQALLQGFAAGAAATGLWELVLKQMKKKEVPAVSTPTET